LVLTISIAILLEGPSTISLLRQFTPISESKEEVEEGKWYSMNRKNLAQQLSCDPERAERVLPTQGTVKIKR
jgi:hypothetical protein